MKKYLTKKNVSIAVFYAFEIGVVLFFSYFLVYKIPEVLGPRVNHESPAAKAFLALFSCYGTEDFKYIMGFMFANVIGSFLPVLYCVCWFYRIIVKFFFTSKTEKPQLF